MTLNSTPAKSEERRAGPLEWRLRGAAGRLGSALYNSAWYPIFPLALLLGGGGTPRARRERSGRVVGLTGQPRRIWLHAASVGEVEAVRPIALGLLEQEPDAALVITTMTETGREAAARRVPGAAACWLAPLDHPRIVRAFLKALAPDLVLISEAELWPNYFIESRRFGARVALLNGRLSARSLKRYRWLRPLWTAALECADLLLVQSQTDADRYLALGAPRERLVVTGNTKYAPADAVRDSELDPALREFAAAGDTLIAGSTGPGEEEQVIEAYLSLRDGFPRLRLVLAPRHLERLGEVEQLLNAMGLSYVKATGLKLGERAGAARILLLDTLGDLRMLYRYGTLAFIGGSLYRGRGGQNLGEPAAAGIAVLFGPFHENQHETARALLAHGGGVVVRDGEELARAASRLLGDEPRRREEGARAREVYQNLAGGAARSLAQIRALIGST